MDEEGRREKKRVRAVVLGSTDFSAATIRGMMACPGYDIRAIVTLPDRTVKIRGKETVLPNPVKDLALEAGIELLQPENPIDCKERLTEIAPDIMVVVAYKILPEEIWRIPELGTIGIHPSFLPMFKGAAPIPWTIACGAEETGITAFRVNNEIDSGWIISRGGTVPIKDKMGYVKTAEKVYHDLMGKLPEFMDELYNNAYFLEYNGDLKIIPHIDSYKGLLHVMETTKKLTQQNTRISFEHMTYSTSLQYFINGMNWRDNNAWTIVDGKKVKLIEAGKIISSRAIVEASPGDLVVENKGVYIVTGTRTGVEILEVKPEGKNIMPAINWINGVRKKRIDYGEIL